jgi:nucleoid-associated protein YgaU
MGFGEFKTKEEESKEKNQQSPDITHIVNVGAGDRLPLLCKRIYGNSKLFSEIARINGLTDFRHIADNTRLIFPPLK